MEPVPHDEYNWKVRNLFHPVPVDVLIVALFFLGVIMVGFASVLVLNRGVFTYMLDDPYIHLAVAEELGTHGHYGVNSDEVSAPCSSPLWPFLLVPFAKLPHFELVPFFINTAAGLTTAMMALCRIRHMLPPKQDDRMGSLFRAGITISFLLATNIIGLVFTGMEHSLQVLLAVCVVEGMLRIAEKAKPNGWFHLAVVVGPWIRYENMALTAAALVLCFMMGQRRQALALGALALAGLVAFSSYLVFLGLSPVPASITAKSTFLGETPIMAVLKNLKASLSLGRGMLVSLCVALLIGIAIAWRGGKAWRMTALCLALAGSLHLAAGAYGWVNRYEIYILTTLIWGLAGITCIVLRSTGIAPAPRVGWALLTLVPVVGFPYLQGLVMLPLACNNIYEQQYQMHRFAVDFWKKPVAVNDLGYVSYLNTQHVLDLWGLASPRALSARMSGAPPEWMSELAAHHHVEVAMVYSPWFPTMPEGWEKVAALRLSRKLITPAWHEVSFFATDAASKPEIRDALVKFRKSLPPGVVLDTSCGHDL